MATKDARKDVPVDGLQRITWSRRFGLLGVLSPFVLRPQHDPADAVHWGGAAPAERLRHGAEELGNRLQSHLFCRDHSDERVEWVGITPIAPAAA